MIINVEHGRARVPRRAVNGILLLDKPAGISSNAALQRVKRMFRAQKAGHTGNLDVLADGLLPICLGEATKLCAFLLDADKTYRSEFRLGQETTTGDREGAVTFEGNIEAIDLERVQSVVARFEGPIEQIPPMFSALKHQGQPLYKLAQRGIEIARAARAVTIHELRINHLEGVSLSVEVRCSKGTYIRTLAEDIGRALGCGAHVASLRRLNAGSFNVMDAVTLAQLELAATQGNGVLDSLLLPMDRILENYPAVTLTEDGTFYLCRGQPVIVPQAPAPPGPLRLYDAFGRFIGVGEMRDDGLVAPKRLVARDDEN